MSAARRRLARGFAAAVCVGSICLSGPTASAHAFLVRSDPPAGAVLASAPRVARLWFSGDVSRSLSAVRLVDADGRDVAGTSFGSSGDPRLLIVELPPLSPGAYGLVWKAFAPDGHVTDGVLAFQVMTTGSTVQISTSQRAEADPVARVLLRWLSICALAGVVGALGVGWIVLGGAGRRDDDPLLRGDLDAARHRLAGLMGASAAAGALVGIAALFVEAGSLGAPGRSGAVGWLLASRWGVLWSIGEVSLVAVAVLSRVPTTSSTFRGWRPLLPSAFVVAAIAARSLVGHAASLADGRALAILADGVHVLAACLWLGGVPALLLVLRYSPRGAARSSLVRTVRTPFAWLAGTSLCALAATGLYGAGRQVATVGDVPSTPYGRVLGLKTVLFVAIAVIGAMNAARLRGRRMVSRGRAATTRPREGSFGLIAVESCLGVVLLLIASVLAGTPPGRGPASGRSAAPATRSIYRTVDDLVVSVAMTPGRQGLNSFAVIAASSRRPPPAPIRSIVLELRQGSQVRYVPLKEIDRGVYFGTGDLSAVGWWRLTATIERGAHRLSAHALVPVSRPPATAPPPVSGQPLAPISNVVAAVVLFLGILVAIGLRRRTVRAAKAPTRAEPPASSAPAALERADRAPIAVREAQSERVGSGT